MKSNRFAISLTQEEADLLLSMAKHYLGLKKIEISGVRDKTMIPLVSDDKREHFFLDIIYGGADVPRITFQNRYRKTIILARIDLLGRPHRNPDDEIIPCPHIHVYRAGDEDKWAFPLPSDQFINPSDPWVVFDDFMSYCNIVTRPIIYRGLYS